MNLLADITALITTLQATLKFIEAVDPNAAQNPVFIKIQSILNELNALKIV